MADLYTYFVELGNTFLKEQWAFRLHHPQQICACQLWRPTAQISHRTGTTRTAGDFGDLPVFAEAVTYPMIVLTSKRHPPVHQREHSLHAPETIARHDLALAAVIADNAIPIARITLTDAYWFLDEANSRPS